jgi:DNA-binding MarR family transcriptional regulator
MPKIQRKDLSDSPCVALATRKASRRLSQLFDNALAPAKLRSTQYSILSALERRSKAPPTIVDLAEVMVMDRSALGHNLRPLERDGLVALESSVKDLRRRHVVMTATGRARHREAKKLWKTAHSRLERVIGKTNAARLRAALLDIAYAERLGQIPD